MKRKVISVLLSLGMIYRCRGFRRHRRNDGRSGRYRRDSFDRRSFRDCRRDLVQLCGHLYRECASVSE